MIEHLEPRIAPAAITPQFALDALKAKLAEFAADKTTPPAMTPVITAGALLTAKADDLVDAVYQLTQTTDFDQADDIAILVKVALTAQGTKVRADKDKIAPRILNAAL